MKGFCSDRLRTELAYGVGLHLLVLYIIALNSIFLAPHDGEWWYVILLGNKYRRVVLPANRKYQFMYLMELDSHLIFTLIYEERVFSYYE